MQYINSNPFGQFLMDNNKSWGLIFLLCIDFSSLIWKYSTFQKFGDGKEINTFIQQGCIQLIRSDIKDIYNVTRYFYSKNPGILEWFLKDQVTLKTGLMLLKIQIWSQE